MMPVRVLLALTLAAVLLGMTPPPAQAQECEFKLGFKLIVDQIPEVVGACLENEHFNVANGNSEQRTTAWHGQGGLLVWRKIDNWTAFTDGYRSWVNGPFGLEERLNTERFPWESDPTTPAPQPTPTSFPAPVVEFTTDSATIAPGQCVTIRWNVSNARAVYLLGAGVDTTPQPARGDRLVCPGGTTTYSLNVVDLAGATTSRPITVTVAGVAAPTVSFTADRTTINFGECTTLRWNVQNVKTVYLRGPDVDTGVVGQGERGVCPQSTSTYRLDIVDLANNSSSASVTINVQGTPPPPTPQPTATPLPVPTPQPTATRQPTPTP